MIRDPKPIGDGICELTLSNGMISLISEGDADTLGRYNWHASTNYASRTWYAKARITDPQVGTFMHRVILCFPLLLVDHINRDGLDNRRENLRLCTHNQNCCNTRNRKGKTSKYRGVFRGSSGSWVVQVRNNCKITTVGSFRHELDAARAYDKFVKSLRGEFAVLNFPLEAAS